jgi:hypothetical protein
MKKINKNSFVVTSKDIHEYKRKMSARQIVNRAIRSKTLERNSHCEICKEEIYTSAHHVDYGKPLSIIWLCDCCHGKVHRKNHPLNPLNNIQTPTNILWRKHEHVSLNITIPIEFFIHLKKVSKKSNLPISKIIRRKIVEEFPVVNDQLTFNFMAL